MIRYLYYTLALTLLTVALLPATFLTAPRGPNHPDRTTVQDKARDDAEPQNSGDLALQAMRERVMAARPLAMYYTIGGSFGLGSILDHASDMTVLAPQSYWLYMNGRIRGTIPTPTLDAARQSKLPVMALLSNRNFNRRIASQLLHNRHLQKRVIRELAGIARQEDLLGFQLDLENIDPADINLYTRFVAEVARELHHDGRLLSVAVVPRFLGSVPGQWAAAYDYSGLARAADFLTLMTYDNSGRMGPPGPIAGYNWVKNALDYARTKVPPQKLLLGIALYGREWTEAGHSFQAHTMPYPKTKSLLSRLSMKPQWDEKKRSPWFQYQARGTVRSVWYENARSIEEKVKLVEHYRLRGFAAWRLGMEDPQIWPMLSALSEGQPQTSEQRQAAGF